LPALLGHAAADDLATCKNGRGEEALAACTRALQAGRLDRTERVRVYNARGILWKRKGDYDRAIADYNAAVELDPQYHYAYYNRGISHFEKHDIDRAIADFTTVIRINPKFAQAYNNRGTAYKEKQDYDRALADYDQAIKTNPKAAGFYNNRGVAWKNKGEYDRAILDYDTAIRLNKDYASAYSNRGVAFHHKGDDNRALIDYEIALRLAPNDADAHNNRAISLAAKGDLDRALAEYGEAIRLNPKEPFFYNNRGAAWQRKGEFDRAIADYDEAIRRNPKYLHAITNRAFIYEYRGALVEALREFRTALAIDPSRTELKQDLRRLEQKLAKKTAAPAPVVPGPAESKPVTPRPPAPQERRVALVIGNGAYENAPGLPNPPNDAVDIASTLRKLGFDVISSNNLNRRAMEAKIREFGRRSETADVTLFYYAGHGLQVAGKNYLLPTDAKIERESDLNFEAIDVDVVLRQLGSGPRANLVFLDACRNNPLTRGLLRSLGVRSGAVGTGLASIEGGIGTMIVFATQPNNVAFDGDERNSPFAAALLAHLPDPDVDVSIMMRRVRADVIRATNQMQVPWDHSSLIGELVLARR
jgi:tetratricopeptide (TPR) repeat protein